MTSAELKTAIWELFFWFLGGTPLIWANQDGERPALPYATLTLLSNRLLAAPWHGEVDDGGNQATYDTGEATLTLDYFGAGGFGVLEQMRLGLRSAPGLDQTYLAGVALDSITDTKEVPNLRHRTQWEPHATADFRLRMTLERVDWVSWIELVEVTETNTGEMILIDITGGQ